MNLDDMSLLEFTEKFLGVELTYSQKKTLEFIQSEKRLVVPSMVGRSWARNELLKWRMKMAIIEERESGIAFAEDEETVDHPSHYQRGGYECIDLIFDLGLDYHEGAALKHLFRAGYKIDYPDEPGRDRVEDLKKAAWYLTDKADRLDEKRKREEYSDTVKITKLTEEQKKDALQEKPLEDLSEEERFRRELRLRQVGVDIGVGESKSVKVVRDSEGKVVSISDSPASELQEEQIDEDIKEESPETPLSDKELEKEFQEVVETGDPSYDADDDEAELNLEDTILPPEKKKKGKKKTK